MISISCGAISFRFAGRGVGRSLGRINNFTNLYFVIMPRLSSRGHTLEAGLKMVFRKAFCRAGVGGHCGAEAPLSASSPEAQRAIGSRRGQLPNCLRPEPIAKGRSSERPLISPKTGLARLGQARYFSMQRSEERRVGK